MSKSDASSKILKLDVQAEAARLASLASLYGVLFERHELSLGFYVPRGAVDTQTPHDRDELYIVSSGSGSLNCDGKVFEFSAGDVLSVQARVEHRFEHCSADFQAWVIFFGPASTHARR